MCTAQLAIHCFDTAMVAPMRVGWALLWWFNDILDHLSQDLPHISSTDRSKPPKPFARAEFKQSFFAQQPFSFWLLLIIVMLRSQIHFWLPCPKDCTKKDELIWVRRRDVSCNLYCFRAIHITPRSRLQCLCIVTYFWQKQVNTNSFRQIQSHIRW